MNAACLRAMTEAGLDFVPAAEHDPAHAPFVGRWEQHMTATSEEFNSFAVTDTEIRPVGHVIGGGWAAAKEVQRIAFAEHKARRFWLDVIETSARAHSLYQAMGLSEEGIRRQALLHDGKHVPHDGKYVPLVIMSRLARECEG